MIQLAPVDTMQVTCNTCGYSSSIANVQLHSCDIQESGGRCDDYPCCGHTDGDGCQTLASHTSDFYYRNPHLMHEPGSPEWQDAMADLEGDEPEWACKGCDRDYEHNTEVFYGGPLSSGIDDYCITCRVTAFVDSSWTPRYRTQVKQAAARTAARRSAL